MFLADDCPPGPVGNVCDSPSHPATPPDIATDPLTQFAHSCADAAAWTARSLGKVIGNPQAVDFTSAGWLKQYAIVFAASTILTLLLWLLAVAKRAVRGVPMTTALSEAVGLLWIAVAASAFTPLALYVVVGASAAVTDVLSHALSSKPGGAFSALADALKKDNIGGGPVVLIIVSGVTIALCGALWLLMVLRALALYLGGIVAPVVQAGLVDRDMWDRVKRWGSGLAMLILIEPIMAVMLGLASVLETSRSNGAIATGLGVATITIAVAIYMMVKIPGTVEGLKAARAAGRAAVRTTKVLTPSGASSGVQSGITTHAGRPDGPRRVNGHSRTAGGAQDGMQAHGKRTPRRGNGGDPKQ